MNLKNMLKASATNLTWLNDPKTFVPQDKDNNQKDDIEIEWGRGDIAPADRPRTTVKNETKINHSILDTDTLIEYVQVLLHQGISKDEAMTQAALRFPQETIDGASKELAQIFKAAGVVGCFLIDLRKVKNPARVVQAAMKSPFKKHIAYVLMTPKQVEESSLIAHGKTASQSVGDGSINGFFASETKTETSRPYYKPLNLPVITARGDLDESFYDNTMVDLVNTSGLPESQAKGIYKEEGDAWGKLCKAFKATIKNREKRKTGSETAANKANDFAIMAESTVEVDEKKQVASIDTAAVMITGPMEEISFGDAGDEVDIEYDGAMSNEVPVSCPCQADIEVDAGQGMDEEFVGTDEIELDAIKSAVQELDVESKGEIDV